MYGFRYRYSEIIPGRNSSPYQLGPAGITRVIRPGWGAGIEHQWTKMAANKQKTRNGAKAVAGF